MKFLTHSLILDSNLTTKSLHHWRYYLHWLHWDQHPLPTSPAKASTTWQARWPRGGGSCSSGVRTPASRTRTRTGWHWAAPPPPPPPTWWVPGHWGPRSPMRDVSLPQNRHVMAGSILRRALNLTTGAIRNVKMQQYYNYTFILLLQSLQAYNPLKSSFPSILSIPTSFSGHWTVVTKRAKTFKNK